MFSNIVKLAKYFEKMAIYSITLYHGTDARNIQNIIQKGLLAKQPSGAFHPAIYLTSDIATAARYSTPSERHQHSLPIILEVEISGTKRVNKLMEDHMDQPYLANSISSSADDSGQFDDNISNFQRKIKFILSEMGLNTGYIRDFPLEITELNGYNPYKKILELARINDVDIQKTKNSIKKYLPIDSDFEHFEIRPDGTIKLTKEYYDSLHQIEYPKNLPSRTIKAVWIPKALVNPLFIQLADSSKQFGEKILAPEIGHLKDEIYSNLHYVDSIENIVENIKRIDKYKLIDISEPPEDIEEFKFDIEEQINYLDWGEEINSQEWLRFPTNSIENLKNVENLYQI